MTVAELIAAYQAAHPTPRPHEEAYFGHWWGAHFGTRPLPTVTTGHVRQAVDLLLAEGEGRNGSTVAFYFRFLRRVMAWGISAGHLTADPCVGIPLPKEPTPPLRVVTEEEEKQLCDALGRPYNLWVRFAILTGLKQSEQFTLLWRSVDLDRGTVLLPEAVTGAMVEMSLPAEVVTILHTLRQDFPSTVWVFADPKNPLRPADPDNFYVSRWTRTLDRLGLPPFAWKDLRHTCGVRLAQQGIPVNQIATCLRQRELKQAYLYRAWQPGGASRTPRPQHPREPVFSDLTADELRTMLNRDLTTAPLTFRELSHLYAAHHLRHRPTREQFERVFRQFWLPWASRPAQSLTRKDVRLWYLGLVHIPSHANKAATFLRALYNWASRLELVDGDNPAIGLLRYRQSPRERFLSLEELQRFMDSLPHLPPKPRAFLLILILTGARHGEVRQMRWSDVDIHTRLWRKPRTKTGVSHCVPLPVQVMEALSRVPKTSEWVFSGTKGESWSRAMAQKTWDTIRRRWNLEDVTLHDLRRTCASYLAISGENLPTIQNVLNHRSLTPTSIYARLNTKAVDRALQMQANRLCSLLVPEPERRLEHADDRALDDEAVCRLIEEAWHRIPEPIQDRYVHVADSTGTPIERLLVEAVDWHLTRLEQSAEVLGRN